VKVYDTFIDLKYKGFHFAHHTRSEVLYIYMEWRIGNLVIGFYHSAVYIVTVPGVQGHSDFWCHINYQNSVKRLICVHLL